MLQSQASAQGNTPPNDNKVTRFPLPGFQGSCCFPVVYLICILPLVPQQLATAGSNWQVLLPTSYFLSRAFLE